MSERLTSILKRKLEDLATYGGLDAETRRNALKEELQYYVLNFIYHHPEYNSWIMYGGSALRIIHGLDRMSVDLDFEVTHEVTEKFLEELKKEVDDYYESDGPHFTYLVTNCDNTDIVYKATYLYKNREFVPESYGPDPELCTEDTCNEFAIRLDVHENNSDKTGEDIPGAFIDDSGRYADILFPSDNLYYLITGLRDDLCQIYSNKFVMVNMPIRKGMILRYKLNELKPDDNITPWITIMIDIDGNGVYEATVRASSVFTGYDFLKQCGVTCAGMEKL